MMTAPNSHSLSQLNYQTATEVKKPVPKLYYAFQLIWFAPKKAIRSAVKDYSRHVC